MKFISYVIILLWIFYCTSNAQWIQQNSGTDALLMNCDFVDSQNGWVNPWLADYLLKTTDGGNNWIKVYYQGGFNSIKFLDDKIGYAISIGTNNSGFNKTTDGGYTWSRILDFNFIDINEGLIYILNNNNVWFALEGTLYKTTDEGQTWQTYNFLKNTKQYATEVINNIFFLNENIGWVNYFYDLYSTKDGGNSWIKIDSSKIKEVYFTNENTGWALSFDNILKTEDGGKTWVAISYFGNNTRKLRMLNDTTGFLIDLSILKKTINGGLNWDEMDYSGLNSNFIGMRDYTALSEKEIWIVGENGFIAKYATDKTLSILSPVGGEKIYTAYKYNIRWTHTNLEKSFGKIEYSLDNGNNWIKIIDSVKIKNLSYEWNTKNIPVSNNCRLKITAYDSSIFSISNSFQVIKEQRILKLIYPTASDQFTGGPVIKLIWEADYLPYSLNAFCYIYDDTSKTPVKTFEFPFNNIGGDWQINLPNQTGFVKLYIFDNDNPQIYFESEFFSITYQGVFDDWEIQNSSTSSTLNSISFYNDRIGWIVGNEGTILKTIDGGESWFKQDLNNVPSPFNSWTLQSVSIVDSSIVFIKGYGEVFLRTTDGGKNWYQIGDITTLPYTYIGSVFFIDSLTGWVAGGNPNSYNAPSISKTTNGGLNWNSFSFGGEPGNFFYTIEFMNKDTGWTASTINLLRTVDGGKNWNKIFVGGVTAFQRKNNILWISTIVRNWSDMTDTGFIYKSTDWGNSWKVIDSELFTFRNICFINEIQEWAIADSGFASQIRYKNNQYKWTTLFNNSIGEYTSIHFEDENRGWIIGKDGLILHTSNGGIVSNVQLNSNNIKSDFILAQNYPNPFNPITTIRYTIAPPNLPQGEALVSLKVYDILGREVATLVNEEKPTGNYEAVFNGGGLSSGIYFYQLKTGDFIQTKKLVLMK